MELVNRTVTTIRTLNLSWRIKLVNSRAFSRLLCTKGFLVRVRKRISEGPQRYRRIAAANFARLQDPGEPFPRFGPIQENTLTQATDQQTLECEETALTVKQGRGNRAFEEWNDEHGSRCSRTDRRPAAMEDRW